MRAASAFLALGLCVTAPVTSQANSQSPAAPGQAQVSRQGTSAPAEQYSRLLEHNYLGPVELTEPLELTHQEARWTLREGRVWLQEPLASGAVTGLVFQGTGRFEAPIPDQAELHQLRRFVRDPEFETLSHSFDRLVLRAATPGISRDLADLQVLPSSEEPKPNTLATRQHNLWLLEENHDADMRVISALSTFSDRYVRATMRLEDLDWVTYGYDARHREEISLRSRAPRPLGSSTIIESWLSLDRPEDRLPNGSPGLRPGGFASLEHLRADINLEQLGRGTRQGFGDSSPIDVRIEAQLRYRSRHDGLGALILQMHPMARITSVRSEVGELDTLRYNTGRLSGSIDNRRSNYSFAVFLPEPLAEGETISLSFEYELELLNFAPGELWYPRPIESAHEFHTAELKFEHRDYYDVMATGSRALNEQGDEVWITEQPTRMVGFTFGRFPHTKRFEWQDLPPTTLFGTTGGYLSAERIDEIAPLVQQSLRCLTELLGAPPSAPELLVTLIASRHAQAFEGFLQVDDYILAKGDLGKSIVGTKELFLGHEIAHQWWGHTTTWDSYRDQWLSEALAEYSSALCVRRTLPRGEKIFEKVLDAFTHEAIGSLGAGSNPFARPGLVLGNSLSKKRMGPIGHGWRAATRDAPAAYTSTAYRKGALVIHMIARRLEQSTGDPRAIDDLLQALLRAPRGLLSNNELIRQLGILVPDEPWEKILDQWVLRADIPHWRVRQKIDGTRVTLMVKQEQVPADFTSTVPVEFQLTSGQTVLRQMRIDKIETNQTFDLGENVKSVRFNPDYAVLARVRN